MLKKIGKYNIYIEEVSPKNKPEQVEWHVAAHDPNVMKTYDVGYYGSEADAMRAAEKFVRENP